MSLNESVDKVGILSYENILISPYNIKLIELRVEHCINEHGKMYFTGIVSGQEEAKYIEHDSAGTNIELLCLDSDSKKVVLFSGISTKMEVKAVRDVFSIEGEAVSHSYTMDVKLKNRSFQNKDMQYLELIKNISNAYNADFMDMCTKNEKIKSFTIQYNETDWGFLKRMASHFNCGLVSDITKDKPKFWFGMPKGTDVGAVEDFHYNVEKRVADFRTVSENHIQGMNETDFIFFEVETNKNMSIGDTAIIKGKKSVICKKSIRMDKGIVKNTYTFVFETGLKQIKVYNPYIKGVSLDGKVIDVKEDNLKVHLEIDKEQKKEEAWWFPYSTFYTTEGQTGWYCMPELGDSIKLYFPNNTECDGVIINSIRKRSKGGDKITKPEVKFFRTNFGKELMFDKDEVIITGKDGKILIKINENSGIHIQSSKNVKVVAEGSLKMSSNKNLVVSADGRIDMACKESLFTMNGCTTIKGTKIKKTSTGSIPNLPTITQSSNQGSGPNAQSTPNAQPANTQQAQNVQTAAQNSATSDKFGYEWTGKHVTDKFKEKVLDISKKLKMNPDDLMGIMAFESNLDPAARNKDTGATGLIQFMPDTAESLGTTTADLAKMSAEDQLDYVYKYFKPYTGKINNIQDAYMVVFMPVAVGKSDDFKIGIEDSDEKLAKGLKYGRVYELNSGLDVNKDGTITKGEAAKKVVDRRNKFKKI